MCSDGDVRLMNSSGPSTGEGEGLVEVCYNNSYWKVCNDRWDTIDAGVVCRQLGFTFQGQILSFYRVDIYMSVDSQILFLFKILAIGIHLLHSFSIMSFVVEKRFLS